jgi:hypothetical protein
VSSVPVVNWNYGVGGYGQGNFGNPPLVHLPIGYYENLMTSQYATSAKTKAFYAAMLKKFDDVTNFLVWLLAAADIDNAEGDVLDQIGAIVGAVRTVPFAPTDGGSPVLDDPTFRSLIYATIAQNQWDGTIDSLQSLWIKIFPNLSIQIQDNQDMTATIVLYGTASDIQVDLITNGLIVPRPDGVLYTYAFAEKPYFGFGQEAGEIAGFGTGHWAPPVT